MTRSPAETGAGVCIGALAGKAQEDRRIYRTELVERAMQSLRRGDVEPDERGCQERGQR